MSVKTYKAKVKIKKSGSSSHVMQDVTVQADSAFNAKAMLEAQYGKGCVLNGPNEVR